MGKLKSGGQPFIEALRGGALVADGGMGTQLYERGILFSVNYEELNLSRPQVVRKVHESYLGAGAEVIETNTFGANSVRLARHGLEDKVREINLAAVKIAAEAAGGKAYLAGSIGPSGLLFEGVEGEAARVRASFKAQAEALAEGGVDFLDDRDDAPAAGDLARDRCGARIGGPRSSHRRSGVDRRRARHVRRHIDPLHGRDAEGEGSRRHRGQLLDRTARRVRGCREARPARAPGDRSSQRRSPASRRRAAHLRRHARVLRCLRASHVQDRRAAHRRLLRNHAGAHPEDRGCRAHGWSHASARRRERVFDRSVVRPATCRPRRSGRSDCREEQARREDRGQAICSFGGGQPAGRSRYQEGAGRGEDVDRRGCRRHQHRRRSARAGANVQCRARGAHADRARDRDHRARLRARSKSARSGRAPSRGAGARHQEPGHHHRRSAQARRFSRRDRGLRSRLDRPLAPRGRAQSRSRSGRQTAPRSDCFLLRHRRRACRTELRARDGAGSSSRSWPEQSSS